MNKFVHSFGLVRGYNPMCYSHFTTSCLITAFRSALIAQSFRGFTCGWQMCPRSCSNTSVAESSGTQARSPGQMTVLPTSMCATRFVFAQDCTANICYPEKKCKHQYRNYTPLHFIKSVQRLTYMSMISFVRMFVSVTL